MNNNPFVHAGLGLFIICIFAADTVFGQSSGLKTENLFIITTDGLRWQEVFTGADPNLIENEVFVQDPVDLSAQFWRDDTKSRRKALMPFFWEVIAHEGQLYGNRYNGSQVNVSNSSRASYPGYNEIITGLIDDERVITNFPLNNPNRNLFDMLNFNEVFRDSVGLVASWWAFPYIVNEKRNGIHVLAGPQGEQPFLMPQPDSLTHSNVLKFIQEEKPRVAMFVYDDTDNVAHEGEYDAYLEAANRFDGYVRELWEFMQSHPKYQNQTTFLITTDHGRGVGDRWTNHGTGAEHSNEIWIAVLGPDSPPLGEVTSGQYYLNQVAKTAAALLGLEYRHQRPVGDIIESIFDEVPLEKTVNYISEEQDIHRFSDDEIESAARAYVNIVAIQRQYQRETPWIPEPERAASVNEELLKKEDAVLTSKNLTPKQYHKIMFSLKTAPELQERFMSYVENIRGSH